MPSWKLKAVAQRTVGVLPFPHFWNGILQKRVSHSVGLGDGLFFDRLDKACRHLDNFRDGPDRGGLPSRVVEIGTGWFPIVPIALWLCGVGTVETYDLSRHATDARLSQTIERFITAWKNGRLARALPDLDRDRLARLKHMAQNRIPSELVKGLAELGIHYAIAPIGPERIPRGSVDLVFSTAVLEYLPYPALVGLLRECCDCLSPNGVVSHWVDLSDEYAYFDRDITPFNFLRFSDRAWRLINNPIIPLSRLRLDEYRRAFAEAGLGNCAVEPVLGSLDDLARVPIAPRFRDRPTADLLAVTAWFRAVPPALSAERPSFTGV